MSTPDPLLDPSPSMVRDAVPTTGGWLVAAAGETRLSDGEYLVGRDLHAAIRLIDLAVSRRHAVIAVAGHLVTVRDLGSRNGTWVNDSRLDSPCALRDGDRLRVGAMCWVFRTRLSDPPVQASIGEDTVSVLPPEDEEVV